MSRGVLLAAATAATAASAARADDVAAAEGLMSRGFALASACGDDTAAWEQCVTSGWEGAASWLVGAPGQPRGFLAADAVANVWARERRSPIFHQAPLLRTHLSAIGWHGRLVLTNGVFDLLHVGHVRSLQAARRFGDLLIVAINSDRSTTSLRRTTAQREFARAELVAALASVDYVVLFDEPDPLAAITELRPAVLVKGGDYRPEQVVGGELLAAWGGRVVVTGYEPEHSSSALARNASRRPRAAAAGGHPTPSSS